VSTEPDRVDPMETSSPSTDVEERSAVAEAALEAALAERNRLWDQVNQQVAERRELEHLRAELRAVRASRVWRLAGRYQRAKKLILTGLKRLREG
jgi:hypothetical protein